MPPGKAYDQAGFIKTFESIARHRHRYDVFRDFVTMSAIALHNAVRVDEGLEQEYLKIVGQYEKDEVQAFCKLLAILVSLLEPEPRDVLGVLYMELELGNEHNGQFFTPPHISQMIANLSYGDQLETIEQPFITLSEPTCGAGGMVLAFAKAMMDRGHNPANKLWVQCIDVDRTAALMCYLQLSLWHIPAQVIVGNTLTLEIRQTFHTPAHHLGVWSPRLQARRAKEWLTQKPENTLEADEPGSTTEEPNLILSSDGEQFDFGF